MSEASLKIVIDARPLARNVGGMSKYLAEILPHLVNSRHFEIILYTDSPVDPSLLAGFDEIKVRTIAKYSFAKLAWYFLTPIWLRHDCPDLYWSPRHHLPIFMPSKVTAFVTVHDFVWKTCPQTMPFMQRMSEKFLMPMSIRRAAGLVCISTSTQRLMSRYFPGSKNKSEVIRHGLDQLIEGAITTMPRGDYFLAVGTMEPRKNYTRLIHGFEKYGSIGKKNLIIAGKKGWLYQDVLDACQKSPFKQRIDLVEWVSDQRLEQLYQGAAALISPSVDEGYGLPAQESTCFGIPLLLSDIPVYRELYPHALAFFDPKSCQAIAEAMQQLDSVKQSYDVFLKNQASWQQCAEQHIDYFITQAGGIKKF